MEEKEPIPESLVAPEQGELFDAAELPIGHELLTIEQRRGRCDGSRLARDQERYQGIVQSLAEGVSLRRCARAWGVSVKVVQAIRRREEQAGAIATAKQSIVNNLEAFAEGASERLLEEFEGMPVSSLSVPIAIAIDKIRDLRGEPSARVEVTHRSEVADFESFIQELEVVSPTLPSIGSGAGKDGAKEGADLVAVEGADRGQPEIQSGGDGPRAALNSGEESP